MADAFRTIIIPMSNRVNARTISAAYDQVGLDMFPTFLSASGLDPATHAVSSGYIPQRLTDYLPLSTWVYDGTNWVGTVVSSGNASAIRNYLTNLGYSFTLTQIQNFLAAMDVSDQQPFDALTRLGIKIIQAAA